MANFPELQTGQSAEPVLEPQARHTAEFTDVVGCERDAERDCVRGDHHVERSDRCAASLKRCPDPAIGSGRSGIERCDHEQFQRALDSPTISFRTIDLHTKSKLGRRNGGDADIPDGEGEEKRLRGRSSRCEKI